MKFAICVISLISIITFATAEDNEGFLPGHTCQSAQDCYIFDDVSKGLQLACWYNVNKCKCQNTIRSDYHLEWKDGKCRMSKYGPCGKKGALEVDCLDDFKCIDDQCRDPANKDPLSVPNGPFTFNQKCTDDGCKFSDDLRLDCNRAVQKCVCRKVYIADARGPSWDLRSYDGDKKCSVGKFGPCGKKGELEIECHGEGLTCVDGNCLDPNHPISELGGNCETKKNCKEGLLCSRDHICIAPHTVDAGKICNNDEECRVGLSCKRQPGAGPWSSPTCTSIST